MTSRTPVHDFLVATSERRRELRGERWDGLRQGVASSLPLAPEMNRTRPHPKFEKGVRFAPHDAVAYDVPAPSVDAACEASTAADKLSHVLRHSAWPFRWEPLNACGQHRAVGTPGALFPVDVYLLARTRRGARALHCSPRDLCLLEAAELPDAAAGETTDALSIVVVGNLGRCVGIYGDLALWLVALEAGMLQAQIRLVARTVGWRVDDTADHDYDATRALLGIAHWSEAPLIRCRLTGGGAASATAGLAERRLRTIRPLPHHAEADAHPMMRSFVRLAAAPPPVVPHANGERFGASGDDGDAFPIVDASYRRSSGIGNGIVRWTRDLTTHLRDAVLADTRRLANDSECVVSAPTPFAVSLAWRPTQSGPATIFDLDVSQARLTEVPASDEAVEAARGMCRYNAALLITIGADGSAIAGAGARAVVDTYLRAGALAQCFSLAAARNGLSARLFMAYPDEMKNLVMPLARRALVQILIGYDTRPNPVFPIV